MARIQDGLQTQKCLAAEFADAFFGSVPPTASFHGDKKFVIRYSVFTVSGTVASMARCYQVFRRIVLSVIVQMVNSDSPLHVLFAGEPFKRASTPMASMGARADFLVENDSVFLNGAVLRREGVKRVTNTPITSITRFSVSPCCLSPARFGTELSLIRADPPDRERKFFPAKFANLNHVDVVNPSTCQCQGES